MILGHRHQCDQCGRIAPWDEHWRRYSSIAHDETCPELMPTLCSTRCQEAFMKRVERGEIELPKPSTPRKKLARGRIIFYT